MMKEKDRERERERETERERERLGVRQMSDPFTVSVLKQSELTSPHGLKSF